VPLAVTLNVAVWPAVTEALAGSAVSEGATGVVFALLEQPATQKMTRTAICGEARIVRRTS
jgi:hypothetical protein